jgi:hypothetical protein
MLTTYIIEEIKKRERGKELTEGLVIECPVYSPSDEEEIAPPENSESDDRGVVILDFTI